MPFMNKLLSRAHMKRTRLRNCYLKKRSEQNRLSYVKQRNYCVSLLRKTKKDYYSNVKDIVNNKQFLRTVKNLYSLTKPSQIRKSLYGGRWNSYAQDEQNAELLNIFFSNAVKNLKIPRFSNTNSFVERLSDPALKAILKHKNHPSTVAIRNANDNSHFRFNEVSVEEIYKKIRKLSTRKSAQSADIPIRVHKEKADIFADYICGFFSESIKKSTFPSILKNANITPVISKNF